jgi:hypothetical protein
LDNWFSRFISKSLTFLFFSVLTSLSLYSQDISVKSIEFSSGGTFCEVDAAQEDIVLTLESDGAVDFRNDTFTVKILGQNPVNLTTLTISNAGKFNLTTAGTVTLSLFSATDLAAAFSRPSFSNDGESTIIVEIGVVSDTDNIINNTGSKAFTVTELISPVIRSDTASDFSICYDEGITLYADVLDNTTYYWRFDGEDPTNPLTTGNTVIKNAGDLINGEKVFLFAVTGSCTSTVVSQTITVEPEITFELRALNLPSNTACADEIITLYVDGYAGTASYTWKIGDNIYNSDSSTRTFNSNEILETGSSVSVIVTPQGSTCGTEKFISLEKIEITSAGSIASANTLLCSTSIPAAITSSAAPSYTPAEAALSYRWEYTTQTDGDFNLSNTTSVASNSLTFGFTEPLTITTWFRRIAEITHNDVVCELISDPIKIEVEKIESGTISPSTLYTCSLDTNEITLQVTEDSYASGGFTYQWQSSKSIDDSSFQNIIGATTKEYSVSVTTTETTFFRRVIFSAQLSDTTCGVATSTIFSLIVNDFDPGTLTPYSTGIYCYGSVPNDLGADSPVVVGSPVNYQWYQVTAADGDTNAPAAEEWVTIDGATEQIYSPPPLIENITYRRGVTVNDGSGVFCETYTEPLKFVVYSPLDVGYIAEEQSQLTEVNYCEGEVHPSLVLSGISNEIKSAMERTGSNPRRNPLVTWEISTDKQSWSSVTDSEGNGNWTRLNRNHARSQQIRLTQTLYYRAKFIFNDVDNDTATNVTTQTVTAETIILLPTGADEDTVSAGEYYQVTVNSLGVSITTQTGSTTDEVGYALEAKLDQIDDFGADYYEESNTLVLQNPNNKTVLVNGIRNASENPVSIDLYYLNQENSSDLDGGESQHCTVYSEVFTLGVTPRPILTLNSGSEYQIICQGAALDEPLVVQWSGAVSAVTYTTIPTGLTAVKNGDSVTIDGIPTSSGEVVFTLVPECDGYNETLRLTWDVTSNPPAIYDIVKDADDPGRAIVNGAGDLADGYNNSICIDTDSTNSTEFYACFNEADVNYANLEWDFVSATYTNSPTVRSPVIQRAPDGGATREDNAEIGVQVTWADDFIENISEPGEWVKVRVRSISKCDPTITSAWTERDVWLVKYDSSETNSQTIPDLPTLTAPVPLNNQICSIANYINVGVPTCETLKTNTFTQFYSRASATTNDFSHLEWKVESEPGDDSVANVGTIDSVGRLFYNSGFYGSFTVSARPVSCSATGTTWVESARYEVGQIEKAIPNVTAYGVPICPIPSTGVVTTTLTSDRDVYWFVKDYTHIETTSVTPTGDVFYGYRRIEGDAGDPLKSITFQWATGSDVDPSDEKIFFKVVPVGCSGEPLTGTSDSGDQWVRNYVVEAPEGPELRPNTSTSFSTSPKICNDEINFTPLVYDIVGMTSVDGVLISQTSNQVSTSVINTLTEENSKIMLVSHNDGNAPPDIPYTYIITINNEDFKYVGSVNENFDTIMQNLMNLIDGTDEYTAVVTNTNLFEITANQPGVPFKIVSNIPTDSNLSIQTSVYDPGYSQYKILGLNQAITTPGTYEFKFSLDVSEGCTDESDVTLTLEVDSNVAISLTNSNTNSPIVCYSENFEDILYTITGLDAGVTATVVGNLPSNVSFDFINSGTASSSTLSITSNGVTNYWNTRTFDYQIVTNGDFCSDGFNSGGTITVDPQDYIRPDGHYDGGENDDSYVQQTICEGEAIDPIVYEYWGVDTITSVLDDPNTLGLTSEVSSRTQKAVVSFEDSQGQTLNDTQQYSVIINDVYSTITAPLAATATSVMIQLRDELNANRSDVITAVQSGTELYVTAVVSGTTFALETSKSDDSVFSFNQPEMLEAPHLITITGTPTFDADFNLAISSTTTYTFDIVTQDGKYCDTNSTPKRKTFTLTVNPIPRMEIFDGENTSICYGYSSDTNTFGLSLKGGISNVSIGFTNEENEIDFVQYFEIDPTSSIFEYNFNSLFENVSLSNVTTTTVLSVTVTGTSNLGCGTKATVTDTLTIVPHFITHTLITGNLSQTTCVGGIIDPIEFEYSSADGSASIIWGTNGNPGDLTLTTSGTTLTLSGTVDPLLAITDTTNYDFVITLLGDESNCIPLTQTGTITVSLGPSLSLDTASTTVEQSLCLGETPDNITYGFGGSAVSVYDPVWKKNGMTSEKPSWVAYNRETSGKFTLQASAIAEVIDVITVYEYELETSNSAVGTSACIEDTKKGYYILFPDAQLFSDADYGSTDFATEAEICEGDYVNNKIYFKSTATINVSPTVSVIGLSSSVSYTSKQSFTISVSGTMSNGQTATLQFLNEDRSRALTSEQWTITATENDTSSSTIAEKFKDAIDGVQPSAYEITQSNHELTISSASDGTLFGLRFLTPESLSIGVVSSTAVKGFMSLTGTLTTNLVTETTVFNVEIESEGSSCSSDSLSLAYYVNPLEEIILSEGNSLNQATCYGSAITPINFSGASRYEVSWSPSQPVGISPPNGALVSTTLQISGTHSNTSGATTSYTYTLSLIDIGTNCITSDTVTGTLTFYPREDLSISSGTDSQTLCTGGEITPIIYDLSSGYNNSTYEVGWSSLPTPEGLNFSYDEAESSLTLSGSVPSSVTTETVYTYTVTFTSEYSCTGTVTTGQFTVKPEQTLSLSSGIETLDQTICESTAIETISFDFGNGATEVETSGIEAIGLDVAILNQTISISGTPTIDVTVPTTYAYTISTVDIYCTPKVETGYITLLPAPDIYFTDSAIPGIRTQEISICNGEVIDNLSITFKNTSGLEITNPDIPVASDGLTLTESIAFRQETEVQITGTSSDVGEVYSIIVKSVGGSDNAFTYTTTETTQTADQIAQALIDKITIDPSTSVSATLDGSKITLFNTTSSTVFSTKTVVAGQASMTALTTQVVQGEYIISGTVSIAAELVTETTSFTIDLETTGAVCGNSSLTIVYNVSPFESLNNSVGSLNQSICYGDSMSAITIEGATRYEVSWSPSPPSGITPSDSQIVSPSIELSGTHLNNTGSTTSYTYTISIVDSANRCISSEVVTGTLTFYPNEKLSISSGQATQTLCTGGEITSIVYDLSEGFNAADYDVSWSSIQVPSDLSFVYDSDGETLTLSGSVPSSLTTETIYTYTVTFTSEYSCTSTSTTGEFTVKPEQTLNLTSAIASTDQFICESSPITAITYEFGNGAISATPSGLPEGLDVEVEDQVITISGTPTVDVTVPTTFNFNVTTVDAYCTPKVETGYITLLPAPEVYFTDSAISGIDSQEVSICNQSAIDEISITFKNTQGLEITGSGIPAGTDNLNASQTIVLRQETEVQISGTSSDVGEVYKIIVKPIGGLDKAFTYTTTETTRTNNQIAAALINEIASDSSTSVSATLDGGTITLFNTTSSTVFSTKTIVTGQASMTALSTQAVQGLYVISGTVSLSSDISSFTLNLQSIDSSGDSICTLDTISVKFNLNDAPSVSVAETTTQYNYEVCDGTTVVLDFDYNGEQTSISAADITWSPENPGFDLITQVGTNSFTLSGDISKTVTQTTTYEYTITTNGSTCSDIEFSGSIDLLPQQLITHVDGTVNYLGGSSIAEGNESQIICDGNQIVPIAYKIEGGSVSHTLTWTTSKPGGISEWKTGLPTGGYSLTISGTVETNVTEVTTFEYTIETVGTNCTSSTRVGALIVRPKPLLNLVDSGTNYQVGVDAVCNLSSSDAVIYQYGGSTVSTEINWTGSTGAMPGAISRSYDSNLDQETYIFNPSTTNSDTVVYEYSISSVSQYGCTPQTILFGSIEVLPSVTILEDYIRSNDITHVSCPGGTDGSIIIPASPESEFMKRIYGGQNAVAQVVSVTLLASDTLEQDDIVRLVVDGVTYSAIVPADTTSNSILQELANEINNGNAQVNTAIAEGTLLLTASTPGISFTTSAVVISSNVTGTIVASTVVSNVSLDFSFEWRKNNEVVGNTMNLTNQAAGSYELTVSINGCATSSATFEIAEPSISYSEVDISCDGLVSIPLSITLTPDQVAGTGNLFSAKLYKIVNNVFSANVSSSEAIEERFSPVSTSSSYVLDFNGYVLQPGEVYKVEVQSESCNELLLEIPVGPITDEITIQENLISVTDIQCWGENDGTLTVPSNAVIGGSGNYSFVWTSATGLEYYFKDLFNVPPGSYRLTVLDNINDCEITSSNVFVVNDTDSVALINQSSNLINQCVDGTNGLIQLAASGGALAGFDIKWEFVPSVTSQTFELTGAASDFQFNAADHVPTGYSTTGIYTYYLYEGGLGSSCAVDGGTIVITGPSPVSLSSSLTSTDITCAGDENGTIQFTATGGVAPYFYSINGGTPTESFSNGNTNYITDLGPGSYDLVIGDSTPADCAPNTFTTQIVLTEPEGGPLELSEGEINLIPCTSGGTGSFQIDVTGGSTEKIVDGVATQNTVYQVFVTGLAGNFKLNTSFDSSESGILIENIVSPGDYSVTVTDGSGNCSQEITVSMELETNESLSAIATSFNSSDCSANEISSSGGGYIQITQFLKGDGEVSGYPLWQKLSTVDMDSFVIALSGSVETIDLSTIGVVIGGSVSQTINASTTGSVTISSLADVAAILVDNINTIPNFKATLTGSTITVKSQIIDSVSELATASSTLNLSVSAVSKIAESVWVEVQGAAGLEKVENLQAGTYRGLINDGSGCGAGLVQNVLGGNIFRIDTPQTLQFKDIEFEEITCTSPVSKLEFKLFNGSFTLVPDSNIFEFNLNSNILKSSLDTGVSFSTSDATSAGTATSTTTSSASSSSTSAALSGNYYTPNFNNNSIMIENLVVGDYELTVRNTQTDCSVVLSFSLEEAPALTYSGETEFIIDPCYERYEDPFFDPTLIEGGTPFVNLAGEAYYSLFWKFYPEDPNQGVVNINSLSNNINFNPLPGRYELILRDLNGCSILDGNGTEVPIEFTFSKELANIVVNGTGGASGDELSQAVSCEIDAEDGKINIEVVSSDPNNLVIPPYDIQWHRQAPDDTAYEQNLLIEGTQAGDSLETYTIRLNEIAVTYITQVQNEPKESVVNELTRQIDLTNQFEASVNPSNSSEIIIKTESLALLDMEIVSRSTSLQLVKSTSNIATWIPLDGTGGNPNYTGFLDLNDLSEGLYRYTITTTNLTQCDNNSLPNSIQDVIIVENENILEIREGPIIDEYLCNGQSGTLFLDVFDGDTGPLTFFYNGTPVTFEKVGTNQYLINIDSPVETANLEIYNAANCGLSREINIGNGTPLFDFTSTNFEQTQTFLAREDVTFSDISENEYDSFEFIFGDGTKSELMDRNTPDPIIHEYAISGTYYVTLRIYNDIGCVEELTKTIKIGKGYSILVPNVFTPNGDIWNSTFRPIFNGLSEITLRVYDSQGGLLYEEVGEVGADPEAIGLSLIGWEGNRNLPSSPYFIYSITAKTIDEEPIFRDGTFILLQ